MIQRIQSVYLFVAALLFTTTIFAPIATFAIGGSEVAISGSRISGVTFAGSSSPWEITFFAAYSAILALISIFAFKNRTKQIRLANLLILSGVIIYITMGVYSFAIASKLGDATVAPGWGAFLPIIAMLCVYLAKLAIRRDEKLVRAADRFR